jgi:hypothetical protein
MMSEIQPNPIENTGQGIDEEHPGTSSQSSDQADSSAEVKGSLMGPGGLLGDDGPEGIQVQSMPQMEVETS